MYNIYHNINFYNSYDTSSTKVKASLSSFESLQINDSMDSLTATASIFIPFANYSISGKQLFIEGDDGNSEVLLVGDRVEIELNYYSDVTEREQLKAGLDPKMVFIGYIAKFNVQNEVLEMMCEDSMWLFKQKKINKSYANGVSSYQVLTAIVGDLGLLNIIDTTGDYITDINLGTLRTEGFITPAKLFENIKDTYGIYTYFKIVKNKPTLYFGLKYTYSVGKVPPSILSKVNKFSYPYKKSEYPVIDNNLSYKTFDKKNDLTVTGSIQTVLITRKTNGEVLTTDDMRYGKIPKKEVIIKYIETNIATVDGMSILGGSDEKTIRNGGNNITIEDALDRSFIVTLNIPSVSEVSMEELIKASWNNHVSSGFTGSFTTMGLPMTKKGDLIHISVNNTNSKMKEESNNKGNYYVDEVITNVNSSTGFTQEITVGAQVD